MISTKLLCVTFLLQSNADKKSSISSLSHAILLAKQPSIRLVADGET